MNPKRNWKSDIYVFLSKLSISDESQKELKDFIFRFDFIYSYKILDESQKELKVIEGFISIKSLKIDESQKELKGL